MLEYVKRCFGGLVAKLPIAKLRRSRGSSCSLARMKARMRTVAQSKKLTDAT